MDSSLDHLPERKRADLRRLAALIRDAVGPDEVEMIILYGSYARGDWTPGNEPPTSGDLASSSADSTASSSNDAAQRAHEQRRSGHASDYDILILTKSTQAAESIELRSMLDRKAAGLQGGLSARPRFIAYDVRSFNERLAEGRFFYVDIAREGRVLYDSGRHALAAPRKLTTAETHRIASEYFEHWSASAREFYRMYELAIGENLLKKAAFNLHQTAEASLKLVLLVFSGYSPDEHWLGLLINAASQFDRQLVEILPQTTDEEERLFKLLDYAYIGARYDPKYAIIAKDLDVLADHVKQLLDRTQNTCVMKLGLLEG